MYSIRTTHGFIVSSRPYGEADRMLSIFTREFGLVTAIAKGIRLEKSKLRYGASEYILGDFSLVKGKEFWRLTSTRERVESSTGIKYSTSETEMIARIALLLRRFLQGEEPNPELFQVTESLFEFLNKKSALNKEIEKNLESLIVLRIFEALGYIGENKITVSGELSLELLDIVGKQRVLINQEINKAMKESHL